MASKGDFNAEFVKSRLTGRRDSKRARRSNRQRDAANRVADRHLGRMQVQTLCGGFGRGVQDITDDRMTDAE